MANECLGQVQVCALRVARLEADGVPLPGANNLYVTESLQTLEVTPVYEDGDEIREKNACGTVCVNFQGDDSLLRYDAALTICTPDPQLMELLGGGDVLTDGAKVGYAYPAIGAIAPDDISIEFWTKLVNDGVQDPETPWAHWAMPLVKNRRWGQKTFANGAVLPQLSGRAFENLNWFDGPGNDFNADTSRALQWLPATDLPDVACGYQTLVAS